MERRTGFVGIILENRESVDEVNHVLSSTRADSRARGAAAPPRKGLSVITLVVEATDRRAGGPDQRLGRIDGVSVKSALSKQGK